MSVKKTFILAALSFLAAVSVNYIEKITYPLILREEIRVVPPRRISELLSLDHRGFLAGHPDPQKPDQPYIASAIADADIRLHVLPGEWNFRTHFFGIARGEVKILHGRGDMPAVAREINGTQKERLWDPRTNQIKVL